MRTLWIVAALAGVGCQTQREEGREATQEAREAGREAAHEVGEAVEEGREDVQQASRDLMARLKEQEQAGLAVSADATVEEVGPESLRLRLPGGEDMTVRYAPDTPFTREGATIQAQDLQPGTPVRATWRMVDGQRTLQEMHVREAPSPT